VGPQDETLLRGEDVDFNWRVLLLGRKILFDPSIKVLHHHRPSLRGHLRQHYMYGRAYYWVRRKWPDMYCVYPHAIGRPRDLLKAVNFAASLFYQPFLTARALPRWSDRLLLLPVFFATGVAWKWGMLVEAVSAPRETAR